MYVIYLKAFNVYFLFYSTSVVQLSYGASLYPLTEAEIRAKC